MTLTALLAAFTANQDRYTRGLCCRSTYRSHLRTLVLQASTAGLFWALVAELRHRGVRLA